MELWPAGPGNGEPDEGTRRLMKAWRLNGYAPSWLRSLAWAIPLRSAAMQVGGCSGEMMARSTVAR